jgi:hypothetical protein
MDNEHRMNGRELVTPRQGCDRNSVAIFAAAIRPALHPVNAENPVLEPRVRASRAVIDAISLDGLVYARLLSLSGLMCLHRREHFRAKRSRLGTNCSNLDLQASVGGQSQVRAHRITHTVSPICASGYCKRSEALWMTLGRCRGHIL